MKRYLLASDFDQTLSFNDSGVVLSELLGLSDFQEKVAGLSEFLVHRVQFANLRMQRSCLLLELAK